MITRRTRIREEPERTGHKKVYIKRTIGAGLALSLTVLTLKCDQNRDYFALSNRIEALEQAPTQQVTTATDADRMIDTVYVPTSTYSTGQVCVSQKTNNTYEVSLCTQKTEQ